MVLKSGIGLIILWAVVGVTAFALMGRGIIGAVLLMFVCPLLFSAAAFCFGRWSAGVTINVVGRDYKSDGSQQKMKRLRKSDYLSRTG